MRSHTERHLLGVVIAVSLALTGLTVWSVAQQGQALQARELADVRNAAATTAARHQAALLADVELAFVGAHRAWEAGQSDELDAWSVSNSSWLLTAVSLAGGTWTIYPLTPLEQPQPTLSSAPADPAAGPGRDLLTLLHDLQRLATSPDPLTRSGALLAMAACEQQLGHPLAAARIFSDAAHLLRSTPHLARFAFRAELSRIDSLWAAGDAERARADFGALLHSLRDDHPARLGPTELTRLQDQAETLRIPPNDPARAALAELRTRADQRTLLSEAITHGLSEQPVSATQGAARTQFRTGPTAAHVPVVLAVHTAAAGTRIAFAAPAADLVARYWGKDAADVPWQVNLPGTPSKQPPLLKLGPEFGGATVGPTPDTVRQWHRLARRNIGLVLGTAAGIAAAWGLVIWVLARVVARQRELARLQGRFVADVSHELKTPLALIRLLAETLASRRVHDPERIQAYHETITHESERLSLLLENILDLGRIESGRKQYEFSRCDVSAIARQAWALFEPRFHEEGFEVHLEIAPDLPVIQADPQALQQVIVNLLQNAHRYAGQRKFVRLSVTREGYVVLITVEDHGLGMTRSQLNRLGESFFRAEDTRVRQQRGVGLGLAIAHHIVSAHHGKIEVQSRPGQGSTFTVWIPFEPQAPA